MEELNPKFYVGIKWGLQSPTVLLAAKHYPSPKDHVQIIRESFRTSMMLEEAVVLAKQWHQEMNVRKFFCDPTQPEFIKIMRRQRLWAVPVEAREVNLAINLTKKRMANTYQGLPGGIAFDRVSDTGPQKPMAGDFVCPNLMAEFLRYRGRDTKANHPVVDKPLEVDNYALSALHFILLGLAHEVTPRVRWL